MARRHLRDVEQGPSLQDPRAPGIRLARAFRRRRGLAGRAGSRHPVVDKRLQGPRDLRRRKDLHPPQPRHRQAGAGRLVHDRPGRCGRREGRIRGLHLPRQARGGRRRHHLLGVDGVQRRGYDLPAVRAHGLRPGPGLPDRDDGDRVLVAQPPGRHGPDRGTGGAGQARRCRGGGRHRRRSLDGIPGTRRQGDLPPACAHQGLGPVMGRLEPVLVVHRRGPSAGFLHHAGRGR